MLSSQKCIITIDALVHDGTPLCIVYTSLELVCPFGTFGFQVTCNMHAISYNIRDQIGEMQIIQEKQNMFFELFLKRLGKKNNESFSNLW